MKWGLPLCFIFQGGIEGSPSLRYFGFGDGPGVWCCGGGGGIPEDEIGDVALELLAEPSVGDGVEIVAKESDGFGDSLEPNAIGRNSLTIPLPQQQLGWRNRPERPACRDRYFVGEFPNAASASATWSSAPSGTSVFIPHSRSAAFTRSCIPSGAESAGVQTMRS